MAPHSSTLAWKIPWTEEPGGLQSMGSLGVGHDWATSLSLFTFMHWRRKWQPTPVFLPGESQGQQSLVGCRLWGRTESDMTEARQQQQQQWNIYIFLMWTIFKVFIEFVIISLMFYVSDFFFFGHETHGVLVAWPGIELTSSEKVGKWGHNHWTTREVPDSSIFILNTISILFYHKHLSYHIS